MVYMNNGYYLNPIFSDMPVNSNDLNNDITTSIQDVKKSINQMYIDQSYIENILKLNKGKKAKFYVTIPGSKDWRDKAFEGIIEQAGRDNVIISNPKNGEWYLILMVYLDYIIFEEKINFIKDFS